MFENPKWSEVYEKHSKKMLGVCKRYVNDISLAEDLMHEGFVAAIQKQNSFSGFGSFEGWLRTIMVNTSLMYLRKNKNIKFVDDQNFEITDNTESEKEMSTSLDLKTKIINTDFSQEELLEVVNTIPEHHKLVFNMYVIDNFSHSKIAKLLDININTSKSHLLRARKKLQELLFLKANEKQDQKRKKAGFWLFFNSNFIDSIYKKSSKQSNDTPTKPFDIDKILAQQNLSNRISSGYFFGITLQNIAITLSILTFSISLLLYFQKEHVSNSDANSVLIKNVKVLKQKEEKISDKTKDNFSIYKKDKSENSVNVAKQKIVEEVAISRNNSKNKTVLLKNKDKKNPKNSIIVKKIIDTIYVYK